MSDISKANQPIGKVEASADTQNSSQNNDGELDPRAAAFVKSPSAPPGESKTKEEKEERRERIKILFIVLAFIVSCVALGVSWSSCNASHRAADIAEKALKTNVENFRLDQRAWINVGRTIYPSQLKAGVSQVDTIGMEFVNSGKTQAIDVRAVIAARTMFKDVPFSPAYQGTAPNSRTNLRPDVPFSVRLPNVTLSQEQVVAIRSGVLRLYVYGEISYQDIFTNHHCTKFCLYFSPDLKGTGFCGVYNEMTDTECDHAR